MAASLSRMPPVRLSNALLRSFAFCFALLATFQFEPYPLPLFAAFPAFDFPFFLVAMAGFLIVSMIRRRARHRSRIPTGTQTTLGLENPASGGRQVARRAHSRMVTPPAILRGRSM